MDDPEAFGDIEGEEWAAQQAEEEQDLHPGSEPPTVSWDPQMEGPPDPHALVGGKRLSRKTKPGLTPYAQIKPKGNKAEQANP